MATRLLSMVLVLNALVLGYSLLRSREAPVEAASNSSTDIRCVGFRFPGNHVARVNVHNAGTSTVSNVVVDFLDESGASIEKPPPTLNLAAGETKFRETTDTDTRAARIGGPTSTLVVDSEMIYDDSGDGQDRRHVTCERLGKK